MIYNNYAYEAAISKYDSMIITESTSNEILEECGLALNEGAIFDKIKELINAIITAIKNFIQKVKDFFSNIKMKAATAKAKKALEKGYIKISGGTIVMAKKEAYYNEDDDDYKKDDGKIHIAVSTKDLKQALKMNQDLFMSSNTANRLFESDKEKFVSRFSSLKDDIKKSCDDLYEFHEKLYNTDIVIKDTSELNDLIRTDIVSVTDRISYSEKSLSRISRLTGYGDSKDEIDSTESTANKLYIDLLYAQKRGLNAFMNICKLYLRGVSTTVCKLASLTKYNSTF